MHPEQRLCLGRRQSDICRTISNDPRPPTHIRRAPRRTPGGRLEIPRSPSRDPATSPLICRRRDAPELSDGSRALPRDNPEITRLHPATTLRDSPTFPAQYHRPSLRSAKTLHRLDTDAGPPEHSEPLRIDLPDEERDHHEHHRRTDDHRLDPSLRSHAMLRDDRDHHEYHRRTDDHRLDPSLRSHATLRHFADITMSRSTR